MDTSFPNMVSKKADLHMLFFPYMAPGHMLPLVDIAKIFAARGARTTILTTPVNAAIIRPTIDDSVVHLHIIHFPSIEFGLPEGCENRRDTPSENLRIYFTEATVSLRDPFDAVLRDLRPDFVVTDMFLPWTYHVAAARGIPRLVFHGTNYFARCAKHAFNKCRLLVDKAESFILPDLPHQIEMLKTQVFDFESLAGTPMHIISEIFKEAAEVEPKSFGVVMNSFYELEPEYADYYRRNMGRKAWSVGPVSLCNQEVKSQLARGAEPALAKDCLKWLDEKSSGSVVYACFGSTSLFSAAQVREIALGLESSNYPFVWVLQIIDDDWMPEGYEERIREKGMVIRGWAPQLLILNHDAIGGFVTHCGWNSSLEGIAAGKTMVTWPLYAEQFYNEKLLVEILGIGVAVGSKVHSFNQDTRPIIEAGALELAVRRVMGVGEEADERRRRAKELKKMACRAVEKGGSSYEDVGKLMEELMNQKKQA